MNSTDPESVDSTLRAFVVMHMEQLAESRRARGCQELALQPEREEASYFVRRPGSTEVSVSFIVESHGSAEEFGVAMQDLWLRRGDPDLARLACALGELALRLRSVDDPSEDLSPYIYVMF